MANKTRAEFEEYVKKLTEAICTELLMNRMEQMFRRCEDMAEQLEEASEHINSAGGQMQNELKTVHKTLELSGRETSDVKRMLQEDIDQLRQFSEETFIEIQEFNQTRQRELDLALQRRTDESVKRLEAVLSGGADRIDAALGASITAEEMDAFLKELEEYTTNHRKSSGQYLAAIRRAEKEESDKLQEYISRVVESLESRTEAQKSSADQALELFDKTSGERLSELREHIDSLVEAVQAQSELNFDAVHFVNGGFREEATRSIQRVVAAVDTAQKKLSDSVDKLLETAQQRMQELEAQESQMIEHGFDTYAQVLDARTTDLDIALRQFSTEEEAGHKQMLSAQDKLLADYRQEKLRMLQRMDYFEAVLKNMDKRIDGIEQVFRDMQELSREAEQRTQRMETMLLKEQDVVRPLDARLQSLTGAVGAVGLLTGILFLALLAVQQPWLIWGVPATVGLGVAILVLVWNWCGGWGVRLGAWLAGKGKKGRP